MDRQDGDCGVGWLGKGKGINGEGKIKGDSFSHPLTQEKTCRPGNEDPNRARGILCIGSLPAPNWNFIKYRHFKI